MSNITDNPFFSRLAFMIVMTMRATAEISTSTELAQASKIAQSENIFRL